jgi:hypothetical protein
VSSWIAFGFSGWIACALIVFVTIHRSRSGECEQQLQAMSREFADARRSWKAERAAIIDSHRAQMDAIRSDVVEFELRSDLSDPVAVGGFLRSVLSKTRLRGERG